MGRLAAIAAVILVSLPASSQTYAFVPPLPTTREAFASLTVTATNTLSPLPQPYDGRFCQLSVNGQLFSDKDASPSFTCSGTTVTWNASNAGFALSPGMPVTARETY